MPEEDELEQALAAAKQTLRLATADVLKRGILVTSEDWDGEKINKVNPSVGVQKAAIAIIVSLRNLKLQQAKAERKKNAVGASK